MSRCRCCSCVDSDSRASGLAQAKPLAGGRHFVADMLVELVLNGIGGLADGVGHHARPGRAVNLDDDAIEEKMPHNSTLDAELQKLSKLTSRRAQVCCTFAACDVIGQRITLSHVAAGSRIGGPPALIHRRFSGSLLRRVPPR